MTVERRIVRAGDVEVAVSGDDAAPLMLLVRMASRGAGLWDRVWGPLAERYRVAQFDLAAPAEDEMRDPRAVFARFAGQCAAVAHGLGASRFHVFGWNGGTHVALRCAIDYPERVASCLLLGPFHRLPDMRAVDTGVEFMRVMMAQPDRELYAYYWFLGGLSPRYVAERFDDVERWARARAAGDRFLAVDAGRAIEWARALRGTWASDAELAAVAVPTLIVAHELDPWHAGPTVEMARALHARMPASRLKVLDGVGSLVLLEDPERFLREVLPPLREAA